MDLSKFKYKATFASKIDIIVPTEEDKYLSIASLKNLAQYFPNDLQIDESPDLLYIAMPSYNGGIANRNGDSITKATAISIAEYFKNKYINVEQNRAHIVGNLMGYGFAKHGSNESISKEEALANNDPIDVILSGYV